MATGARENSQLIRKTLKKQRHIRGGAYLLEAGQVEIERERGGGFLIGLLVKRPLFLNSVLMKQCLDVVEILVFNTAAHRCLDVVCVDPKWMAIKVETASAFSVSMFKSVWICSPFVGYP